MKPLELNAPGLAVALVHDDPEHNAHIREALDEAGIGVVAERHVSELDGNAVRELGAAAVIVNLDDAGTDELDQLQIALAEADVPVLFNDATISSRLRGWDRARWVRHLLAKITGSDRVYPAAPEARAEAGGAAGQKAVAKPPQPQRARPAARAATDLQVWVLGASIGGPDALRRFLGELPADTPLAFVLAQHMGPAFLSIWVEQLKAVTDLEVRLAEDGDRLLPGRVLVVPTGRRVRVEPPDIVRLVSTDEQSPYSPCIDWVMDEVADHFGANAGAIVFSGMATDGVEGARRIAGGGGTVWAQDAQSCVVSSMADGARGTGAVSRTANPLALAVELRRMLNVERAE